MAELTEESMIDLYTASTPNGQKVHIMLEETALEYKEHFISLGKGEQFNPKFLKISPNNKIPAIVDKSNGRSMMESGAILLYLADKEDRFWGDDRWETIEWLMLQMGGIGPMLGQAHHFLKFNPGKAPYAEDRYRNEAHRLYGVLDRRLADREYLSGSYSIADMATWPWISRYEWHDIDWNDFPNLKNWYLKLSSREAVQRGYDVPRVTTPISIPQ